MLVVPRLKYTFFVICLQTHSLSKRFSNPTIVLFKFINCYHFESYEIRFSYFLVLQVFLREWGEIKRPFLLFFYNSNFYQSGYSNTITFLQNRRGINKKLELLQFLFSNSNKKKARFYPCQFVKIRLSLLGILLVVSLSKDFYIARRKLLGT